ncbi:MAG: DUF4202 domain-containing protein [Chloroflexi bacterium]|nr:DUF4202 domain-containing protein [Chloroflexota bacterium]
MTLETPRDCADAERFARAIAAIDAANAADPATILVEGEPRPKELTHAALLCEWVARLVPAPGEALLLAARAHHIRRWTVPRASYPPGRSAYLRWRRDLRRFHADEAARILRGEGYDEPLVERVQQIVRKEGLFSDPEVQTLEDGLNLVFLQTQFDEFRERLGDDERLTAIVRRTWRKMSERGREAALGLDLSERGRAIVARALEGAEE